LPEHTGFTHSDSQWIKNAALFDEKVDIPVGRQSNYSVFFPEIIDHLQGLAAN
jgi:hypothetical protein